MLESRKEKAELTKKRIYDTAVQLFAQSSFDEVSVSDITKHAGVAKGSFYVHFESKNALVASLLDELVEKIDTDYRKYIESFPDDTPASEIFMLLVEKIADVIINLIGLYNMKCLYKAQISKEVNTGAVTGYSRELYQIFNDVINKGIGQGVFQSVLTVDEITKHCITAYRGLVYEWCLRYPDFDLKEQALAHFKLILHGLCKQ
jgi:AcrR family transcriptional regulator